MWNRTAIAIAVIVFATSATASAGERETIREHLLDVEAHLREVDVSDWSVDRRRARAQRLDELRDYALEGRFPKNTRHPGQRVPYFIDDYGTACAVAHLMIESGEADGARAIAARENNAWVMEMRSPELRAWLPESGLTAEEAAWIQPSYSEQCFSLDEPIIEIEAPENASCDETIELRALTPNEDDFRCRYRVEWSYVPGDGAPPLEISRQDVAEDFQTWTGGFVGQEAYVRFPENGFGGTYEIVAELWRDDGSMVETRQALELECQPEETGEVADERRFEEDSACSSAGAALPGGLIAVLFLLGVVRMGRRRSVS